MRKIVNYLLLLTLVVKLASSRRIIRAAQHANKTGNFVVRVDKSVSHDDFVKIEEMIKTNSGGSLVYEAENDMIKVVTAHIKEDKLEEVKNLHGVEYLEEETYAHGTQNSVPYHLDQIDQGCSEPLDNSFQPTGDGEGTDIYILDSGIHYTHSEFNGRAKYSGKDPVDDYNQNTNNQGLDCHGHGTHCASLAGGLTTGVATKANLYSVRVLGCDNFGPWSAIISGLNHAMDRIQITKRPSIISMSLGGDYFKTVDDLITEIVGKGITVVVAAGNDGDDACKSTPASNNNVITVGASKENREMYFYSNGGTCVNIIAPGQNIIGADRSCNTCKKYLTGTSMATPLVAGAAALLLQKNPSLTPSSVRQRLISDSCSNTLNFANLAENLRSSTPNKLLRIQGGCGAEEYVSSTSSKEISSPNYPQNYPNDVECIYILTTDIGRSVRLNIQDLQTYDSSDFLEVINGGSVRREYLLASLNYSMPSQKYYQSTSNALTLRFKTNSANNRKGFRATFDSVEQVLSSVVSTVTSTVTETALSTRLLTVTSSQTVVHTLVSLSIATITSIATKDVEVTKTVQNTKTVSVVSTNTLTVVSTQTIFKTDGPSASLSTVVLTTTVTEPVATPTPVRLLPMGTPDNDVCCSILNNFDAMSFTVLEGVNKAMERGIDYLSKLIDRNSSVSEIDRLPHPSPTRPTTQPRSDINSVVLLSESIVFTPTSSIIPTMTPTARPIGIDPDYPANSCANITTGASGEYWLLLDDGSVKKMFCELANGRLNGMAKIVDLDMTERDTVCPDGLKFIEANGKRMCGRSENDGCSSAFFTSSGMRYSRVCGKIRGYQFSSPNGFYWFSKNKELSINDAYVDGVILTYNKNIAREHIWTFASAVDEVFREDIHFACPCTHPGYANTTIVPEFMNNNYFCDTGSRSDFKYKTYYTDDPLWDGKGCGSDSSCCNKGDLFCVDLDEPTTSDIELRICANEALTNEDTPVDQVKLYVQ